MDLSHSCEINPVLGEGVTMPKLKTKKGLAKRFRITKTGKIKRQRSGRGHLLSKKSRKRKRMLKRAGLVCRSDRRAIKKLLPY
jgi:large subunit ribosomal protein L35